MTHPALTPDEVQQEVVPTDRIIRARQGSARTSFACPTTATTIRSRAQVDSDVLDVLLAAERLQLSRLGGRLRHQRLEVRRRRHAPGDAHALPPTTMDNITVLLHDGGGNRAADLAYLQRLIPWARAQGYAFQSLPQVSPQVKAGLSRGRSQPVGSRNPPRRARRLGVAETT